MDEEAEEKVQKKFGRPNQKVGAVVTRITLCLAYYITSLLTDGLFISHFANVPHLLST
mgnify:FL=1